MPEITPHDEDLRREVTEALHSVASGHPEACTKIENYIATLEKRCRLYAHQDPFRAMVIDLYSTITKVVVFLDEIRGSSLSNLTEAEKMKAETALSVARAAEAKAAGVERRWQTVLKEGGILALIIVSLFEILKFVVMSWIASNGAVQ